MTPAKGPSERAKRVSLSSKILTLALRDGRKVSVPLSWFPRIRSHLPSEPVLSKEKRVELALGMVAAEYQFASSLIPMYRGYQMKAVGFGMTLYGAAIGLIGAYKDSPHFGGVLSVTSALISFPIAILVLAFWVTEIRIKRASRYIDLSLSKTLDELLDSATLISKPPLLKWEKSPGHYLTPFEKWMSGSQAFILSLAFPAFAASSWFLWSGRNVAVRGLDLAALIGWSSLIVFVWYTSKYSTTAEQREIELRG